MSNTLELYLIRHTEPLIEKGVCYGQLDCDVTADYAKQLKKIGAYFSDKDIHAIYSSPLLRCAKLAEDLTALHPPLSVTYKEDFKEINFGEWEGVKWNDINRGKIDEWNNNRLDFQFPGGETPSSFHSRVIQALCEITDEITDETQCDNTSHKVLVIAHAGVIRSILCHYLHIPFYHSTGLNIDYASISKVTLLGNVASCRFVNSVL